MNPAALEAFISGDMENFLVASTPGGIEFQEAAGQAALVASASIPKEIHGATREQLMELGFKFGADIDELFVQCDLPPGWTKRATDHSMHSDLLDNQGRKRAGIFYKAAFYDRNSNMNMRRRFNINPYMDSDKKDWRRCIVTDGEAIVFDAGEWHSGDYAKSDELQKKSTAWLDKEHPGWKNPLAYW